MTLAFISRGPHRSRLREGRSSTTNCPGGAFTVSFGMAGDLPVPADYDGDGVTDFAVWRPATGGWWVLSGADRTSLLVTNVQWGQFGDCPVPGRLAASGAGPLELNVFRPRTGTWFIGRSQAGQGGTGMGVPELLDAYPRLTREDVQAAIRFAADAIAHEECD